MEQTPNITPEQLFEALQQPLPETLKSIVEGINDNYEYWNTVKYKQVPAPYSPRQLWTYVVLERLKHQTTAWNKYGIHFGLTNKMQRLCHEMDMNFGGSWGANSILQDKYREQYLVSSLMEEAISSSQMEGASTTRKVAKEMLRKKITPKDKSQQMIYNNYQTIRFIVEHKNEQLTREMLQKVHALMTEKTLEQEEDAGRFRTNNEVVVEDGITHEFVHTPPSFEEIPEFVDELCQFFNETQSTIFIHPIIRGIIIHFMLAYMHPFVDGNGRTARALFYWYMLRQGYWLMEYLSISRIIYKGKKSYEKSFLYTEQDHNDMGYFITYNLRVLELSFKELQQYIKRKCEEKQASSRFLKIGNLNTRQAEIIQLLEKAPQEVLTVKDLQIRLQVTPTTINSDLIGLMERGIITEIPLNKVKKGYITGPEFDKVIQL